MIARYTIPQIHWTNSASGSWTTDGNWTQGIEPNSFHDTLIDPATSLTVTAPTTNKTVKSLVLGGGGSGVATLRLSGFGTGDLRALDATTITPNGELVLENGRTLSASLLANGGVIHGTGTIHAPVVNERSGQIRVGSGERLVLTGVGNANDGLIQVIGGEIEFTESLTNAVSTGLITARNATLRFGGGLTNKGNLGISFGTSDVNGEIENIGGITISGGSSATFYDDVTNRGTINVSAGSTAVFFGELSGSGVSGSGTVYLEGDARPGFSPGTMAFGGDLWFGPLATLEIEIGGPTPGTQSDRLIVANSVSLAGTLDATTINGFAPTLPGQSFTIITAGSLSGMFHAVAGQPSRTLPGMFWDVTYTPTSALLFTSAIPGDINLDGDVDRTDAALFSQYFGMKTGSIWTTGDFNGDAATTLNDWVLLRTHLGQSVPSPLESRAAAGVPEPAASWLAVLALTLVTLRRRR
ncbi:MAG: dockerin type I domain-containing protein [Pirellulales bacterium]